jgi:hypothetical protein
MELNLNHSIQFNLLINNMVAMVTVELNANPQFSKAHLTNLNLNNFRIIEAKGFKIIALRSP